jgi:hypothetical protein
VEASRGWWKRRGGKRRAAAINPNEWGFRGAAAEGKTGRECEGCRFVL